MTKRLTGLLALICVLFPFSSIACEPAARIDQVKIEIERAADVGDSVIDLTQDQVETLRWQLVDASSTQVDLILRIENAIVIDTPSGQGYGAYFIGGCLVGQGHLDTMLLFSKSRGDEI